MANVPVGFRFHPTDEELIQHYLHLKNNDGGAAAAAAVAEFDLYGETEPWTIWETHGGPDLYDQDLYFFTRLKKVNPHGTRINRKIGTGTWSEGEPSRPIYGSETAKQQKSPIGRKRKFRYENKTSEQHGCWYMEEYSLDAGIKSTADYVICRLRENNRSSNGGGGGNKDLLAISVASSMEASGPIPVGFRFHPTDQELIGYFLYNKNQGKGSGGLLLMDAEAAAKGELQTLTADDQTPLVLEENGGQALTASQPDNKEGAEKETETEPEQEKKVTPEVVEMKGKDKKKMKEGEPAPPLLLEYKESRELELLSVEEEEVFDTKMNTENKFLHEFDLFGSTEPWEIWEMFKGAELCNQDLFFFTQLKKVNPKGSRIGRKVGTGGTWSEGDVSRSIVDATGKPIGRKRKLRYEKVGSPHHACWYLDEYSLFDTDVGDYVICRLRKNDKLAAAAFSSEPNSRKRKSPAPSAPAAASHPVPTITPPAPTVVPPAAAAPTVAPAAPTVAPAAPTVAPAAPTEKESKQDEEGEKEKDASQAMRKRHTELTLVEEAAADVLMSMANNTIHNNKLKLFGFEIGSNTSVGGE